MISYDSADKLTKTNPIESDDWIFLNRVARFSADNCLESLKSEGMSVLSGFQ